MSRPTSEVVQDPTRTCPECGAPPVNGLNCWDKLGAIIAWESEDPDLGAEHFLTVACYNLEHPAKFTIGAIAGLRTALIDRLDNGTPVAELRRRAAREYSGCRRVARPEAERKPVLRSWSMTIANVYLENDPHGAAERVRSWAASIRSEL